MVGSIEPFGLRPHVYIYWQCLEVQEEIKEDLKEEFGTEEFGTEETEREKKR